MLKPQTSKQQIALESVRRLQGRLNRAVLLREVAQDVGQPLPTVYPAIQELIALGILTRGAAGKGKGVQMAETDKRYREGWKDAVAHLEAAVTPQLLEHHASLPLSLALAQTFHDAGAAAEGEA